MSYFSFKGQTSEDYGLKLISMPPPPRGGSNTEIITIPGRAEKLTKQHEEYDNIELPFEFLIEDKSKTRNIYSWLKGTGKLIFGDEPDKYYNAVSSQVIEAVRISDELRSFTVKFICSPFAYSIANPTESFSDLLNPTKKTSTINIRNNGSYACEPLYYFEFAGKIKITINSDEPLYIDSGIEDGEYTDTYTPSSGTLPTLYHYNCPTMKIFINSGLRIAYVLNGGTKTIVCNYTSGKYPILDTGTNSIKFEICDKMWEQTMGNGDIRWYKYNHQSLTAFTVTLNERWL